MNTYYITRYETHEAAAQVTYTIQAENEQAANLVLHKAGMTAHDTLTVDSFEFEEFEPGPAITLDSSEEWSTVQENS